MYIYSRWKLKAGKSNIEKKAKREKRERVNDGGGINASAAPKEGQVFNSLRVFRTAAELLGCCCCPGDKVHSLKRRSSATSNKNTFGAHNEIPKRKRTLPLSCAARCCSRGYKDGDSTNGHSLTRRCESKGEIERKRERGLGK